MPNPTTDRPIRSVFSNSLGFGATARAFVSFDSVNGLPTELITGQVAKVWEGIQGQGVGCCPRPGTFPFTPTASPCLRLLWGSPAVHYEGCNFQPGDGNVRTFATVFRMDWSQAPGVLNTYFIPIVRGGLWWDEYAGGGFGVVSASTGLRLSGWAEYSGPSGLTVGNLLLTTGTWYAIAYSCDLSGGAGAFKYKFQLYNYDTQTESVAAEITNGGSSTSLQGGSNLVLGGDVGTTSQPCAGRYAAVLLDKQYWSQANFQSFYTDPWATVRGVYSSSGVFTAPTSGHMTHGEDKVRLSFSNATGTGVSGSGNPIYHLQRYDTPDAAVSAAARIVTNIAPDAGGAVINVDDTTIAVDEIKFYRLECVDGTSTVYYPASGAMPVKGTRRQGGPIGLALIGDSRNEGERTMGSSVAAILSKLLARPVVNVNRAKSGLTTTDWTPTTGTYLNPLIALLTDAVGHDPDIDWYIIQELGSNDQNLGGGALIDPVTYGNNCAAIANALTDDGHVICFMGPPFIRVGATRYNDPVAMAAANGYHAQLAALHNGVNKFYLGNQLARQCIMYPYGSPGNDGLHSIAAGSEVISEMQILASNIERVVFRTSAPSGGSSSVFQSVIV